jgi:hypothetical protein
MQHAACTGSAEPAARRWPSEWQGPPTGAESSSCSASTCLALPLVLGRERRRLLTRAKPKLWRLATKVACERVRGCSPVRAAAGA